MLVVVVMVSSAEGSGMALPDQIISGSGGNSVNAHANSTETRKKRLRQARQPPSRDLGGGKAETEPVPRWSASPAGKARRACWRCCS